MSPSAPGATSAKHQALRSIAIFEGLKGTIVFVLGFGLLGFLGHDDARFVEQWVVRMHIDPANRYLHPVIHALSEVSDTRLVLLMGFATFYTVVRFTEAYGLWRGRRWAEWFAALSGALYIPVELYEMTQRITWLRIAALTLNLVIVAYMVWLLTENRRRARTTEAGQDI